MSNLKFVKSGVIDTKTKLVILKDEMISISKSLYDNFNSIKTIWEGTKSKEVLSVIEELKKKTENLNKRLDENASFLESVIKTYDEAESAAVSTKPSDFLEKFFISISPLSSSGKVRVANFEGQNYFIVNTAIDPFEYGKIVYSKGMSQRTALSDQCLMIAQWYAQEIMLGNRSKYSDYLKLSGGPSTRINNSIKSQDIETVKSGLFDILNNGNPAVVKVSRAAGGRHYVTAIGYKGEVTKASDLNENNILVLDNASGKITTLADSGYGNRKFYAEKNGFEVIGPNKQFIEFAAAKTPYQQEA